MSEHSLTCNWGRGRLSALVAVVLLSACASVQPSPSVEVPEAAVPQSAERSASAAHRSPFNEPPGVFLADVTQASIDRTICVPGWTATVRPSASLTQGLKKIMLTRVGLPAGDAIKYVVDHFVPLAIGGHPRSEDNLWLQRWDGAWNARVKNRLERKLHVMVCAGQITLHAARSVVQNNWHSAYLKYVVAGHSGRPRSMEIEEEEVVGGPVTMQSGSQGESIGLGHARRSEKWRLRCGRLSRSAEYSDPATSPSSSRPSKISRYPTDLKDDSLMISTTIKGHGASMGKVQSSWSNCSAASWCNCSPYEWQLSLDISS